MGSGTTYVTNKVRYVYIRKITVHATKGKKINDYPGRQPRACFDRIALDTLFYERPILLPRPYCTMICHIKVLSNGILLAFGRGRFDHWCVYMLKPGKKWYAPRDRQYFKALKVLGDKVGAEKVYHDFVAVYERTTGKLEPSVIGLIDRLAADYGEDAEVVELWFTVIYAGMVAEENKKHAILKKRIKRLGIHQLLAENMAPEKAASFSRNKREWMLDILCQRRGF